MIEKTFDLSTNLFIGGITVEAVGERLESSRESGAIPRGIIFCLIAAMLVSGCAAAYQPVPLPANHPASPAASEAPLPPPSRAFRGERVPLAPAEETSARGFHSGPGAIRGGH